MAELDRLDRLHGLGAMPTASSGRTSRPRRQHGPVLPGLLVSGLLLAGVVAFSPADSMVTARRLLGFDDHRLGVVPTVAGGAGHYKFIATQRGSSDPVAYDPCRVIEVVVNPAGAPPDYDAMVDTAIRHTSGATGLAFERVGVTDARDVTGDGVALARRRPVLVAWATPQEVPALEGDVAGIGGSVSIREGTGRRWYITGKVILDRDAFADLSPEDRPRAQAIVDHEFGHVVGLAHVDDPGELMFKENVGQTTYGPGDREGLARLGSVDC